MINLIKLLIVFLGVTISIYADIVYKIISYECNQHNKSIILEFQSATNEEGRKIISKINKNQWDIDSFISSTEEAKRTNTLDIVQRTCNINNKTYTISISAIRGNMNPQGRCGAWRTAWASIEYGNKTYLNHHAFEPYCLDWETPRTNKIIFDVQSLTLKFEEQSSGDF